MAHLRLIVAALLGFASAVCVAADVTVKKTEHGATVHVGDELFTEYLTKSGNKPVLWPLIVPGGKALSRGYPNGPQPGDTTDHIHQRGLSFTHGDVNGVMFWNQEKGSGETVHREFVELESGPVGVIKTRNDWLAPDGKRVLDDEREYRFSADDDTRTIDTTITLHANDGDVTFTDNKEGSFALRVADSIKVDAKKGGKIVSSEKLTDADAWGKPAKWVDYHGPVDGETIGVAIFDHPQNLSYPTRWHVRGYGLFAANPFTEKAFDASLPLKQFKLSKGESLTLRYRTVFHRGDEQSAKIAERYEQFVKEAAK